MEESLSDSSKILGRLEQTRIGKDVIKGTPKVSIIIPCYNISEFIVETIDSVFAQTFTDFEVIIVNDGSQDTFELEEVLSKYFDRIIYAKQSNYGASEARNAAICLSSGELIAFLDADDVWFPDYLKEQIKFLKEKELDMIYCDAEFFGSNYFNGKTYMQATPSNGEVNTISLIEATCNALTSGTILKREKLAEVNLFDTREKTAQDFDLWLRLAKHGAKIGYQRKCLLKYRLSPSSLSGSNVKRAERSISVLHFVKSKYEFTSEETKAWNKQIKLCEAELELERGKFYLIKGDYPEAKKHIAKANEYFQKPKLSLIKLLVNFSPALTLRLFKQFRPNEFLFISYGNK